MLTLTVGAADLVQSRFAIPPIFELDNLLRALSGRSRRHLGPLWGSELRPRFVQLRRTCPIDAVLALNRGPYAPNFLAPPPEGVDQSIDADLEAVRNTPRDVARREITRCVKGHPAASAAVADLLRRQDVVQVLADIMATAWRELLEPSWRHLRLLLEADVLHRSERLGRSGWGEVFREIHSDISWETDRVTVRHKADQPRVLRGEGLLLMPSVFTWPGVAVYLDEPWHPTLAYPALGAGALLDQEPVSERARSPLSSMLGASRAGILLRLETPRSTTALSHEMRLPVGAVGDHVAVLKMCGLIVGNRSGRSVVYRRTATGHAAVAAASG